MKKAAKVFIWIGIICQFWLIFSMVVGIIALTKLNKETSKEKLIAIGVLTLIFCNTLGGIFMLCIREDELTQLKQPSNSKAEPALDKIETLFKMKEEGLITEEEFAEKKQQILKDI